MRLYVFFFSSRRRHTRFDCDWSSDVCSSDLATIAFKCATATLNDVQHEWCKRYIARLEKRSNGQIKGQIFPASQLGSIPRMIEGAQFGTIEAWIGPPAFLVGIHPRFQVLSAPFLFDDFDPTFRTINDRQFLDRF